MRCYDVSENHMGAAGLACMVQGELIRWLLCDLQVPLMAVAGAAHDAGKGTVIFSEELMGMKTSSFRFDG